MDEIEKALSVAQLVKLVGEDWKEVLEGLKSVNVLKSFETVVMLRFDKGKALHIQSVLEFNELKEVPNRPYTISRKDQD